jgi:hypothetical protein
VGCHGVGVGGLDALEGVPAGLGCRKVEHSDEPGFAVGTVIGEGFAGPFAGDQDAPSGVAEVGGLVGFAPALTGDKRGYAALRRDGAARAALWLEAPRTRARRDWRRGPLTDPAHPGTLSSVLLAPDCPAPAHRVQAACGAASRSASPSLDPALLRLGDWQLREERTRPAQGSTHELRPAHHTRWILARC